MRIALAVVLVTAAASGCAPLAPPATTPPAGAAEIPLEVRWARRSAEHAAVYAQTYRAAGRHLQSVIDTLNVPDWAVVLDADETVLDNSLYQRERAERGLGYTPESWNEWVRREAAPALPGAVEFGRLVRDLGGRVVIVTNRADIVCDETRSNLAAVGVAADAVLCQVGGEDDKSPRFQSVEAGGVSGLPPLRVVMWLGDNIRDFPGLSQDVRLQGEPAYDWFGRTYWVFPNPMYGSWTRNPEPAETSGF